MFQLRRWLAVAGLIVADLAAGWPATATAAAAGSPVRNDALYGVSCTSGTQCMAVGSHAVGTATNFRPLAERWDGTAWRVVPMPGPATAAVTQLSAISCKAVGDCVAVGYHYGAGGSGTTDLAEHWNGSRWQIIQSRDPAGAISGFLNDVNCRGLVGCIAVGTSVTPSGTSHAMAELWSGGRWHALPVPLPAGARAAVLNAISCGRPQCMAVGMYQNAAGKVLTLAEHWAAGAWQLLRPASENTPVSALDAVSCKTQTLCMAVGYSYSTRQRPLIEMWANGRWQLEPGGSVADGALSGISCPGPASCITVGSAADKPLSEAWNGKDWRVLPTIQLSGAPAIELNHLSCNNQTLRCVAVGAKYRPGHTTAQATLGESWSGTSWRVTTTRNP